MAAFLGAIEPELAHEAQTLLHCKPGAACPAFPNQNGACGRLLSATAATCRIEDWSGADLAEFASGGAEHRVHRAIERASLAAAGLHALEHALMSFSSGQFCWCRDVSP
jgi:hypothetical protein